MTSISNNNMPLPGALNKKHTARTNVNELTRHAGWGCAGPVPGASQPKRTARPLAACAARGCYRLHRCPVQGGPRKVQRVHSNQGSAVGHRQQGMHSCRVHHPDCTLCEGVQRSGRAWASTAAWSKCTPFCRLASASLPSSSWPRYLPCSQVVMHVGPERVMSEFPSVCDKRLETLLLAFQSSWPPSPPLGQPVILPRNMYAHYALFFKLCKQTSRRMPVSHVNKWT